MTLCLHTVSTSAGKSCGAGKRFRRKLFRSVTPHQPWRVGTFEQLSGSQTRVTHAILLLYHQGVARWPPLEDRQRSLSATATTTSNTFKAIKALSQRLRSEGVDCHVDQYEMSPPEGWPQWIIRQIERADFVLVVSTETYTNVPTAATEILNLWANPQP